MADRDAWEQPLYRFAAILLRDPDLARKVTLETIEAAILKPPGDAERLAVFLFLGVRRRALKTRGTTTPPAAPRTELPPEAAAVVPAASPEKITAALHALAEPGRSALALLLLDALEADQIAKLLGLAEAELATALHTARLALHAALASSDETFIAVTAP